MRGLFTLKWVTSDDKVRRKTRGGIRKRMAGGANDEIWQRYSDELAMSGSALLKRRADRSADNGVGKLGVGCSVRATTSDRHPAACGPRQSNVTATVPRVCCTVVPGSKVQGPSQISWMRYAETGMHPGAEYELMVIGVSVSPCRPRLGPS